MPDPADPSRKLADLGEAGCSSTGEPAEAESGTQRSDREQAREEALARIKASRWPLPFGYRFDRDEINKRQRPPSNPDTLR